MRHTARQAEYRPQGKAVAGSEEHPVSDRARQSPQRSMFAAQQIVGEIQSSEHVERAADNADQRECVLVHSQANVIMQASRIGRCPAPETNRPAAHSLSRFFGVSRPSSASWKVP